MLRSLSALLLVAALAATPAAAGPFGAVGDLYVTSDASNVVRQYDVPTGNFAGNFTSSFATSGQMAIHFGSGNNRFLVGHISGGVEEFDATTGAYIKTYNPGGGWQWAGLYGPGGIVLIGDMMTNDVRKYDPTTGAFLGILCPATGPSDMRIGPNGNLYICLYGAAAVLEVDAVTGATVSTWSMPAICRPNDIAFLPGGDMIVTAMGANIAFRFDAAHNVVGVLSHSLWGNPHGVDIGPHDGNIYIVDGVTGQTHVFDPATNLELNPAYLIPTPGDKIVDLEFKRPATATPAIGTTWGAIKQLWR